MVSREGVEMVLGLGERFCVWKFGGESGSRMRGQPKRNSALNSHFAKGRWERIEGREACEAFSCLDVRRWRVSCRPQGAFVAGGARRRRLSWLRPPTARLWRFGGMRR